MKIPKMVLWVLLAVIVFGVAYGTMVIRRGFSTKDQPSELETVLARAARNLSIPAAAKDAKNPYPPTGENIKAGLEHFADHCALCHANDGSGRALVGMNLYPKPPNMRFSETQNLNDGEIFYIINNGVRLTGMPGWGTSHQAEDTWKLVLFIRHLPQLSAEEEKEMQGLNPKGADNDDDDQVPSDEPHHH